MPVQRLPPECRRRSATDSGVRRRTGVGLRRQGQEGHSAVGSSEDGAGQQAEQSIVLGGGRLVGTVSVDGGAVRGEGGPVRPQLVVPVTIEMNPQPDEAMIAVVWLFARLGFDQYASPHQIACQPISHPLVNGFHAHSLPHGSADHRAELRFFLTPAEVEDMERRRHDGNADTLQLYLGLDPIVAGMKTYNSFGPGQTPEETPWNIQFGMFSQVLPFWTCQVQQPVWVQVEPSVWARDVLPGLGYDRLRLLELTFPPPLPDHTSAAGQFDKAKRALDARRYGDCIQECRGLLNMWEKQYGATSKKRIAEIIAAERGWPEGDIRRQLLDTLWKEVGDVANAPHHPEGDVSAEIFTGRDARLLLVLTSALSEYVARN